jgi:hypothetical protein
MTSKCTRADQLRIVVITGLVVFDADAYNP